MREGSVRGVRLAGFMGVDGWYLLIVVIMGVGGVIVAQG